MRAFDTVAIVDWSARSTPSPRKPSPDAIWIAVAGAAAAPPAYVRTRAEALRTVAALADAEIAAGRRLLIGFDFPFGYPKGFAQAVCGSADPLALWAALAARIRDGDDNANDRFAVAAALNRLFPGVGPFWGAPANIELPDLPHRGSTRHGHGLAERRGVERLLPGAQPVWKLFTTGSVGSQALLGLPRLHALRSHLGADCSVRPFQPGGTAVELAEVYPSLLADAVTEARETGEILDRAQVRVLADALHRLPPDLLEEMLAEGDAEEGWILGAGRAGELRAALAPQPARGTLPPGVNWTPLATALSHLKAQVAPVAGVDEVRLGAAVGRILAAPAIARHAHPPYANAAVDGYGFAAAHADRTMPLVPGRAAAGHPYAAPVPPGHALRILTGAVLPAGVDTVALQETATAAEGRVTLDRIPKPGANTRAAAEDVAAGAILLPPGHRIAVADLPVLAATGIADVSVRRRLRVGVIATGDELIEPGAPPASGQIPDANRPTLLALLDRWGHVPLDLGKVADGAAPLRAALDGAGADAVLVTGGASTGEEDHVARLLHAEGDVLDWRVAVKPGRPVAVARWGETWVFALPGNPVAAVVCALVFAYPALQVCAGATWGLPRADRRPAAFAKSKGPGRTEFLRARVDGDGRVEVFGSEGSGRVSGLAWADGLVELPDPAAEIRPGDPVRYRPFTAWGL